MTAEMEKSRLQQAMALVITGIILYLPANLYPVMTITITGEIEPLTVLGGVQELYESGLPLIALIVFIASILVPFLKLAGLIWLLLMHGSSSLRRQRCFVHRIIHKIGSWSMVDIFLLSVLVAVGQLGILASVETNIGALFFSAVLICTLFAVERYDLAMIWVTKEESN